MPGLLKPVKDNPAFYNNCMLCPRNCGVDRHTGTGFCGAGCRVRAARAALHFYEEPFLSGTQGSGAVFFSGCSLGCVYCQNGQISREHFGLDITTSRLAEIFLEQQEAGAHNLNLVTGTHFTPSIAAALKAARTNGLYIPVVWNSSGYEKPETLHMLEGLVDIFLPDFKTLSPRLAARYMKAPDYPKWAMQALCTMVQMSGGIRFEPLPDIREEKEGVPYPASAAYNPEQEALYEGESVLLKQGVVVRHLVIPGQVEDSKAVIKYLYETYGNSIWISLMSQYTPTGAFAGPASCGTAAADTIKTAEMRHPEAAEPASCLRQAYPELLRTLSREEYDDIVDYAIDLGVEQCMIQEGDTASDSFIPLFDGTGITKTATAETPPCRTPEQTAEDCR